MIIKLNTEGQKNIVTVKHYLSELPHEDSMIGCEREIYSVSAIDGDFPITEKDIGKATVLDPLLSRVLDFVLTGWPEKCDEEELKPYHIRSQELSYEQNCVLSGSRVIIPQVKENVKWMKKSRKKWATRPFSEFTQIFVKKGTINF